MHVGMGNSSFQAEDLLVNLKAVQVRRGCETKVLCAVSCFARGQKRAGAGVYRSEPSVWVEGNLLENCHRLHHHGPTNPDPIFIVARLETGLGPALFTPRSN